MTMFRAAVELYKGLNHKNRYAEIARRKDGVYFYRTQRIGGGEQMSAWEEIDVNELSHPTIIDDPFNADKKIKLSARKQLEYICFNNAVYERHYYRLTKIRLPIQ